VVRLTSVLSRIRRSWQGRHASRLALRARRKGRAERRPLAFSRGGGHRLRLGDVLAE